MSQTRPFSVHKAQHLQLRAQTYVSATVEKLNAQDMAQIETSTRHYVKVPAPSVNAGVGDALRHAFHMNGEGASLKKFQDLLDRLR